MLSPHELSQLVLWLGFLICFLLGATAQLSQFCTMGALSDLVHMGDWLRMRQWLLAIGVAMIGFASLACFDQIKPQDAFYASNRWFWLSTMVGGLMFGFGMVMASGCGNKTLVRMGSGNLKSWVVFVMMGLAAFATLKGITAVVRYETVDRFYISLDSAANLGQLISQYMNWNPLHGSQWAGIGLGGLVVVLTLSDRDFFKWANIWPGLMVGALVVAMWWVSGHLGYLPEHPETLEPVYLTTYSGRMESLSFVAPAANTLDWLLFFSDRSKVLNLGVVSAAGVLAGSFVMACFKQGFRWEGFKTTEDLVNHLVGAILMGIGGVTAMGCSFGQGLSGVSTLALNSFTALAFIVVGALLAFRYLSWRTG
jgi:hypothetical protein